MTGVLKEALKYSSRALDIESRNIANRNVEGAARQKIVAKPEIIAGAISGIRAVNIRDVDQFRLQDIRKDAAKLSFYTTIEDGTRAIRENLGTLDKGELPRISAQVSDFFRHVNSAMQEPGDESIKGIVVESASRMAISLAAASELCVDSKAQAEKSIQEKLMELNNDIKTLAELNLEITQQFTKSGDIADLENSRDSLITKIAQAIMLDSPKFGADGTVMLKSGGTIFIHQDQYVQFEYYPNDNDVIEMGEGLGTITCKRLQMSSRGGHRVINTTDYYKSGVTKIDDLEDGSIRGLIQLREVEINKYQYALDGLAFNISEHLNRIHNSGSPYPGRETIKSISTTKLDSASSWLGSANIAIVDDKGKPVSLASDNFVPQMKLNLEMLSKTSLSGAVSTRDIINEINAHFGTDHSDAIGMGKQGDENKFLLHDLKLVIARNEEGSITFDLDAFNSSDFSSKIQVLSANIGVNSQMGELPADVDLEKGSRIRTFQNLKFDKTGLAGNNNIELKVRVVGDNGVVSEGNIKFTLDFDDLPPVGKRIAGTPSGGDFAVRSLGRGTFLEADLVDESGDSVVLGDVDGYLEIKSTSSAYKIVMEDDTSSANYWADGFGLVRRGFGHFFGLNNLFKTASKFGSYSREIEVRSDIESDRSLFSSTRLVEQAKQTLKKELGTSKASASTELSGNAAGFDGATITVGAKTYTLVNGPAAAGQISIAGAANEAAIIDKIITTLNADKYYKDYAEFSRDGNNLVIEAANKGTSGNLISFRLTSVGAGTFAGGLDTGAVNLAGGTGSLQEVSLSPNGFAVAVGYQGLYSDIYRLESTGDRYLPSQYVNFTSGKISTLAAIVVNFMSATSAENSSSMKAYNDIVRGSVESYKNDYGFDKDAQVLALQEIAQFRELVQYALSMNLNAIKELLRDLR